MFLLVWLRQTNNIIRVKTKHLQVFYEIGMDFGGVRWETLWLLLWRGEEKEGSQHASDVRDTGFYRISCPIFLRETIDFPKQTYNIAPCLTQESMYRN